MPTVCEVEIVGEHDQADGIELDGTMQATISGVLIRRCRYGVHLVRRNRNVLLADSHIYHGRPGGIGVYLDGVNLHQANIVGCHISYCPHAGIKVARSEVRNLQITGCDIEYNFDPTSPTRPTSGSTPARGPCARGRSPQTRSRPSASPRGVERPDRGARARGVRGRGAVDDHRQHPPEPAGQPAPPVLPGRRRDGQLVRPGLRAVDRAGNCRHVVIGTNTFDHNPDYARRDHLDGIRSSARQGSTSRTSILEGCRAGGPDEAAPSRCVDSREVLILGCQVLDPDHRGIDLVNVRHVRVSECTIVDRRAAPTMSEAIRLTGPGRGNLILNNLVGSGTRADLAIDPARQPSRAMSWRKRNRRDHAEFKDFADLGDSSGSTDSFN